MEFDSKNALERLKPDKLVQADVHISSVCRLIQSSTNPDKIIAEALTHPITMTGVLLGCMDANDKALDEVAHLLLIKRVFATYNLDEDVTFATRCKRHVGGKVPSERDVIFNKVSTWWKSSPQLVLELTQAIMAIALFELLVMCAAPTLYTNDHWIH